MRREVPTDEQILNTMSIVYRRANRMKDMSAAFAAASAAHPRDEGLLRGVFVSYVRQVSTSLPDLSCASTMLLLTWTVNLHTAYSDAHNLHDDACDPSVQHRSLQGNMTMLKSLYM